MVESLMILEFFSQIQFDNFSFELLETTFQKLPMNLMKVSEMVGNINPRVSG